eukprot:12656854-Alexandrium_andersonii.AAC.1
MAAATLQGEGLGSLPLFTLPKCQHDDNDMHVPNVQSNQCSSMLNSTPIRNPPCGKCKNASGAQRLRYVGRGTASTWAPEALEERIL